MHRGSVKYVSADIGEVALQKTGDNPNGQVGVSIKALVRYKHSPDETDFGVRPRVSSRKLYEIGSIVPPIGGVPTS